MIEFVGFWVAVLVSFVLGLMAGRRFSESTADWAYAQGVADERAASRRRGQELAEVIDLKQQFES